MRFAAEWLGALENEESPMELHGQTRGKAKGTGGARRAVKLLTIVTLGITAGLFSGGSYFLREIVLFVGVAALLAFFAANLIVLGILLQAAGRGVAHSLRRPKPVIAAYAEAKSENTAGSLVDSRPIGSRG
jgi:hypothetical protein